MSKTPANKKSAKSPSKPLAKKAARVLAEELLCHDGVSKIGLMTLNSEKTMNAVDLEMINLIDNIFARWQADDSIVAMVMRGAGDRAFCAGGDIRQLYDSMTLAQSEDTDVPAYEYADAFFSAEYSKNYRVHLMGKPLIAWGNGFVMGGGLGLFVGANHKVGTENLKLAWPEINIGLFPDVAGSYYLSRLPAPLGHWMGLTGSQMNALDCQQAGLVNYCLPNHSLEQLITDLCQQPWQRNKAMNNQFVRKLLQKTERESDSDIFPVSNYQSAKAAIEAIFDGVQSRRDLTFKDNKVALELIHQRFTANRLNEADDVCEGSSDWFKKGRNNFLSGCPATAHLVMQQLQFGRKMTLKEVAMWELTMAMQSVRHPDFAEGVRAMVVDKDYAPKWQHSSIADVPEEWVKGFFEPLWNRGEHPFSDL